MVHRSIHRPCIGIFLDTQYTPLDTRIKYRVEGAFLYGKLNQTTKIETYFRMTKFSYGCIFSWKNAVHIYFPDSLPKNLINIELKNNRKEGQCVSVLNELGVVNELKT